MTTEQHEETRQGEERSTRVLESLCRLHFATALMPEAHPSIEQAARRVHEEFRVPDLAREAETYGVASNYFVTEEGGEITSEGLAEYASALHALEVSAIVFAPEANEMDFKAFARLIVHAPRAEQRGKALCDAVRAASQGRIEARGVSMAGLGLRVQALPTNSGETVPLSKLLRAMVWGEGGNVEEWAAGANGADARTAGAIGEVLGEAGAMLEHMSESERSEAAQRVGRFVSGLDPELRRRVVSGGSGERAGAIFEHIAEHLSVETVIETLSEAAERKGGATNAAVMLMSRLSGIMQRHPEHAARLHALHERCGGASADASDSQLRSILHSRDHRSYTPEDYQNRLIELSSGIEATHEETERATDLNLHVSRIALRIAADARETGTACAGARKRVMRDAAMLIESGDTELLVRTEESNASSANRAGPTPDAGDALLGSQGGNEIVLALLRQSKLDPAAAALLSRIVNDARALATTAVFAAQHESLMPSGLLSSLAARLSDGDILHSLEFVSQDEAAHMAMLSALAGLPTQRAEAILTSLTQSRSAVVRAASLRVMASIRGELSPAMLRRSLCDEDAWVRDVSLRQIARRRDAESREIAGAALEGTLHGRCAGRVLLDALVDALVAQEHEGLVRAAAALTALSRSVQPTRAAVARRLAARLREHDAIPEVRIALSRWGRSIGRLVDAFALPPESEGWI